MPTVYQSSHTGSNIDIAITKTLGCQGLPSVSNTDSGKMLQVVNGLWSAVQPESNLTMASVLNTVYPVGAIYLSVNSTSPATLFGGTWEQLKDKFLLGVGDTYTTAGSTGGAASQSYTPEGAVGEHTLTTDEIPSHNHTFTGTAVDTGNESVGHTHGFTTGGISANHTHTGTSGNPSANHTHSGPKHTHTWSNKHSHSGIYWSGDRYLGYHNNGSGDSIYNWATPSSGRGYHAWIALDASISGTTSESGTGATGTVSAWHTHTTTTGNQSQGHTHSGTTNGISANHTHSVTAAGTIGNTGSGSAHNHSFSGTTAIINTMPPYLSVYIWKRTA